MSAQRLAVVTGATGRLGRNVVYQFLKDGWRSRGLLLRASARDAVLDKLGAEKTVVAIEDLNGLSNAVAGAEAVVHILGAFGGAPPDQPLYYFDANLRSTVNLLTACERANPKPGRFIFASSDAVYDRGRPPDHALLETDPVTVAAEYCLEKVTSERFCWLFHPKRLPCVVVRPPLMLNVDDVMNPNYFGYFSPRFGLGFARAKAATNPVWNEPLRIIEEAAKVPGQMMVFRNAQGKSFTKHLGYVADVARGIVLAAGSDKALGETFNIMGVPFDFGAAAALLRRELKAPIVEVTMPETPVHWEYDLTKAERLLGFKPQFDAVRIAEQVIAWKRGQPVEVIPNAY